ncbi:MULTISPECIES: hypothetical protein [unclassified Microbacterium]|uniref:hypothetical protein n=1 Tax=unclassified Microbacterium TaxID=2609290 RepID=UPI00301046EC
MSDLLSAFDATDSAAPETQPLLMTPNQRAQIRSLFAKLDITAADRQFVTTAELTGVRITSVGQLEAVTAQRLIEGLARRVANAARTNTGNSWDDRDEDTWIDRL